MIYFDFAVQRKLEITAEQRVGLEKLS
jgi:hypothetical protein